MDSQTSDRSAIIRNSSKLTILTLISRVLGLIREMTKGYFLGTSGLSDTFTVAFAVPNLFRKLFAEGSISVAFVPTFKGYLIDGKEQDTRQFLSSVFTVLTFLVTLTVLIGIIITPIIIPLFGQPGDETTLLTRIMFPYLALISLAALLQGILNGVGKFTPSGFTPILFNICIIAATYLLSPFMANSARAMSVGVTAGGAAQLAFQIPYVFRLKFRFSFTSLTRAFRNPGTRRIFLLVGPTIIGMAAYELNETVSLALAGNAGEGVAASLNYSLRLLELILGLFAVSIGTVMLPQLTVFARKENWEKFNSQLAAAINAISLITIPVAVYAFISSDHIVRLLFKGNEFTEQSVALTSYAFRFHLLGLFFIAQNRILAPAFYAQSDTKSPSLAGVLSFGVNIILAFLFVSPMKGGGIALALSISSLVNTVFLLLFLRQKKGTDEKTVLRSTGLYMMKIILFAGIAGVPVFLIDRYIYGFFSGYGNKLLTEGVPLMLTTLLFAVTGIAFLLASRDKPTRILLDTLRRRNIP